jgi:hypothetical protein
MANLVIGIALIGVGLGLGYFWAHKRTFVNGAQGCFEVSEVKVQQPHHKGFDNCDLYPCIVGIVQNKCDLRFETIILTYNLYDASGIQIGSTDGYIDNLEPHGKAHFVATLWNAAKKIPRFKLTKIAVVPT